MKTSPNIEQNIKALKRRRDHLKHMIRVLTEDGKVVEHHQEDLDDTLLTIKELEREV